jgi:ParB family chromosome partitioning protein
MKTESSKLEGKRPGPTDRGVVRMEIAIGDLVPDTENRPIDESDEEFVTLADSIRVMGVLVALQAQRRPDGRFLICDGERRWRAAQRAGLASVPCDVWPESAHPRDLVLAGVVINEQRQAHSCLAVARRLRAVKNQFAESHEQVAARAGLPVPRVKAYLNLFNASDRLLGFFEEANLPLKTAVELTRFEKALGEVATRRLLERHTDEPLTARAIEALRKRMEAQRKDADTAPATSAAKRPASFSARVEAAFRRDPKSARAELEAVAAKFGLRVVAGSEGSLPGA